MDQHLSALLDLAKEQAKSQDWAVLASTLADLSMLDEPNRLTWAAQGAWLSAAVPSTPPADLRAQYENLFLAADGHVELQRILTARLMWLALPGGGESGNPDAAINATHAARTTAALEGIETQEEFGEWLHKLLSSDRQQFAEEWDAAVAKVVGDRWLFDRARVA